MPSSHSSITRKPLPPAPSLCHVINPSLEDIPTPSSSQIRPRAQLERIRVRLQHEQHLILRQLPLIDQAGHETVELEREGFGNVAMLVGWHEARDCGSVAASVLWRHPVEYYTVEISWDVDVGEVGEVEVRVDGVWDFWQHGLLWEGEVVVEALRCIPMLRLVTVFWETDKSAIHPSSPALKFVKFCVGSAGGMSNMMRLEELL